MPQVPKILLLQLGDGHLEARSPVTLRESGKTDKATFYVGQKVEPEAEFGVWLDWVGAHGVLGTGPSAALNEHDEQSYAGLIEPWMNHMTHARRLLTHAYSVDPTENSKALGAADVDDFFTNRTSKPLKFQDRPAAQDMDALLCRHGCWASAWPADERGRLPVVPASAARR